MIDHGWNSVPLSNRGTCGYQVGCSLLSLESFDPVILIALSLDGHSSWVITRAALLYKQIDLMIRDDGGRLYDRGKANLSPLCNKTAATSPNVCNIEGKKELFMSCYFKIPKGSFFLCWLLNHVFCFALVLVEILKVVYIWKEQTLIVLYDSTVA